VTTRLDSGGVERLLRAWDAMSEVYAPGNLRRWDEVCHRLSTGLAPGARILDLGCGPGTLTRRLAQALPTAQVTGADGTAVLIDLARASRPEPADLRFVHAWLEGLNETVDVVVSSAMLHYVTVDVLDTHLEQLRALLPRGGRVLHVDTTHRAGDGGAAWSRWWAQAAASGIVEPSWPAPDGGCPVTADEYARAAGDHRFGEGQVVPLGGANLLVALEAR
jgi:cyclopropane fatty-acyl-phospholipid synthase-like methyltransferase